ncbi:MAG: hypothetical protein IJW64_04145 [Clostridia bacterium]|nr:hypothetical protein [Clostridia bacterium]
MTNSKRKSKNIFVFILLICVSISLVCVGTVMLANAEKSVNVSKEISENYAFGDEFTAPDCTFTVGSESAKGEHSLRFPDGTYEKDKTCTLNQSGNYLLKYVAMIGGKVYTKEYDFVVDSKLATFTNDKTSINYGKCTSFGANSHGLNLKIANGDSITFGHVFDMTELTSSVKIVEGFVVPEVQGKVDFSRMVFTFTDIYDPTVQLVYYGNFHNDINSYGLTFFTAAGNGQVQTGLEYVGKLHTGSTLGCLVPHSFMSVDTGLYYGAYSNLAEPVINCAPDEKKFCISYDHQRNQAWAGGKIISDLDDNNYYSALWFGFPSGKAKLTISALGYSGASANICLTSVLGVDLTAEKFEDKNAPEIAVDCEYEQMPTAIVGGAYPVPNATASDKENGKLDVNVSVWYEYSSENKKSVEIKNGKFKVENVGTYAIVYKAVDYSGNVAEEVLWVRATLSQNVEKLKVEIGENYSTTIEVGTIQTLPSVTVTGGSGKTSVKFTLSNGNEKFDVEGDEFILEKVGEWTLTCTANDYVGSVAVATKKLNGETSGKPVTINEPRLPDAYVSGGTYILPLLNAYDYSSGEKVEKICSVNLSLDGKTSTVKSGEKFTPVTSTSGKTVKITYVCDGESLYEKEIPVIIVFGKEEIPGTGNFRDVVNVENYFIADDGLTLKNGETVAGNQGIKITATKDLGVAKTSFINPQLADFFSLGFFTVPNESKFDGVAVTLTDSQDESVSVRVELFKDDGQTKLIVGDTEVALLFDFDGVSSSSYSIGYSSGKIVVNATTSISVSKTQAGAIFNGFPSGKIYFDIEIINVLEGATVFLNEVSKVKVANNQDNAAPYVTTFETLKTTAVKDSEYVIQKVVACDVLSPNVESLLTVKNPDGTVAVDKNGVPLEMVDATKDYAIVLNSYGRYSVEVITQEKDWLYSNVSYFEYAIAVVDGEAPTITFKGKFKDGLKVGGTLTIPKFEVTDSYSPQDKITVMIMITNPKGMPIYLYGEERSIVCEYAGEYKICIYAYDETGNLAVYEKTVTVK